MLRDYLGEGVALLSSALSLTGGVAEGKDDWTFIEGRHVPDYLFREGSGNSCHTCKRNTEIIKAPTSTSEVNSSHCLSDIL